LSRTAIEAKDWPKLIPRIAGVDLGGSALAATSG
jgi:hypothetical protein